MTAKKAKTRVIKRDGVTTIFNKKKIREAIILAMKNGSGIYLPDIAKLIANDAEKEFKNNEEAVTISQIEEFVYNRLIHYGQHYTAKCYEGYRAVREYQRLANLTDEGILGIIDSTNEDVLKENSNKSSMLASTQRDLIAGEVSKDISRRKLIPAHIVQAHDEGAIHFHDMDYTLQQIFNCCLVNLEDMLQNGTVINGKLVESPKSFTTACTVTTQIMAQIASNQYGGQSITIRHLAPFLRVSYDKAYKHYSDMGIDSEIVEKLAKDIMNQELKDGVQTIRYQLSTLQTTNGQWAVHGRNTMEY